MPTDRRDSPLMGHIHAECCPVLKSAGIGINQGTHAVYAQLQLLGDLIALLLLQLLLLAGFLLIRTVLIGLLLRLLVDMPLLMVRKDLRLLA